MFSCLSVSTSEADLQPPTPFRLRISHQFRPLLWTLPPDNLIANAQLLAKRGNSTAAYDVGTTQNLS